MTYNNKDSQGRWTGIFKTTDKVINEGAEGVVAYCYSWNSSSCTYTYLVKFGEFRYKHCAEWELDFL